MFDFVKLWTRDMFLVWAAAWLDTEGCVTIGLDAIRAADGTLGKKEKFFLCVQIYQQTPEPLEILKDAYGGMIGKAYPPNMCHGWRITSRKALAFLNDVFPYLIIKKKHAELAFQFYDTFFSNHASTKKGISDKLFHVRNDMRNQMKALNKPKTHGQKAFLR